MGLVVRCKKKKTLTVNNSVLATVCPFETDKICCVSCLVANGPKCHFDGYIFRMSSAIITLVFQEHTRLKVVSRGFFALWKWVYLYCELTCDRWTAGQKN